jgi:hypothetical protein
VSSRPHRVLFVVVESAVAVGGAAGAVQLASGTFTPPISALAPLGLKTWRLPAAWLFASVAVPSGTAAWLAYCSAPNAPAVVIAASAALAVELAVQIPFVGPSALQAVFGGVAIGMTALALDARRGGWRPT